MPLDPRILMMLGQGGGRTNPPSGIEPIAWPSGLNLGGISGAGAQGMSGSPSETLSADPGIQPGPGLEAFAPDQFISPATSQSLFSPIGSNALSRSPGPASSPGFLAQAAGLFNPTGSGVTGATASGMDPGSSIGNLGGLSPEMIVGLTGVPGLAGSPGTNPTKPYVPPAGGAPGGGVAGGTPPTSDPGLNMLLSSLGLGGGVLRGITQLPWGPSAGTGSAPPETVPGELPGGFSPDLTPQSLGAPLGGFDTGTLPPGEFSLAGEPPPLDSGLDPGKFTLGVDPLQGPETPLDAGSIQQQYGWLLNLLGALPGGAQALMSGNMGGMIRSAVQAGVPVAQFLGYPGVAAGLGLLGPISGLGTALASDDPLRGIAGQAPGLLNFGANIGSYANPIFGTNIPTAGDLLASLFSSGAGASGGALGAAGAGATGGVGGAIGAAGGAEGAAGSFISGGAEAAGPILQVTPSVLGSVAGGVAAPFIAWGMHELQKGLMPSRGWQTFPERVGQTLDTERAGLQALAQLLPLAKTPEELQAAVNIFQNFVGGSIGGYGAGGVPTDQLLAGVTQGPVPQLAPLSGSGGLAHGVPVQPADFAVPVDIINQYLAAQSTALPGAPLDPSRLEAGQELWRSLLPGYYTPPVSEPVIPEFTA